jgi:eukaryotic-like serine/threonine-protein kinase
VVDLRDDATEPERFFVCPTCGRWHEQALELCPDDGAKLRPARRPPGSLVGKVLMGRFLVDGVLGEGGMGTVYRAMQQPIGRLVALKVLRAELASDPAIITRFHTEATAASALANPNTVTIYDFGQTADGALYLAMEHLTGPTLADRLARGPLTVRHALEVAAQVCRALAEAHQKGIVHRDLKPDNVVLSTADDGSLLVKVVDFGIAKVLRQSSGLAGGVPITQEGAVIGTPRYMSPEQARGQSPGPASDLYALGVILFEMIAGAPPFDAPRVTALIALHTEATPPPLTSPLGPVPVPVAQLVGALLAKAAGERPAPASAVGAALRAHLDGAAVQAADVLVATSAPAATTAGAAASTLPLAAAVTIDDTATAPTLPRDVRELGLAPARPAAGTAPAHEGRAAPPPTATQRTIALMRKRRWVIPSMLLGLTVLVMGVGVAVVATIGSGGEAAQTPEGPDAIRAPAAATGPAQAETGAQPGDGEPDHGSSVSVLLDSDPPGARVSSGADFLCYTPCRTFLPAHQRVTLRFRRQGYQVGTYQGELQDGAVVAIELEPSRAGE